MLSTIKTSKRGGFILCETVCGVDHEISFYPTFDEVVVCNEALWAINAHTKVVCGVATTGLKKVITGGPMYLLYIDDLDKFAVFYANWRDEPLELHHTYAAGVADFKMNDHVTLVRSAFKKLRGVYETDIPPGVATAWNDMIIGVKEKKPDIEVILNFPNNMSYADMEYAKARVRHALAQYITVIK